MCVTEVGVRSGLRKSVLIHRARVRKSACLAVHVVGRTKLSVGNARRATRDTVAAACPCPAHRVAHCNVDRAWHKGEALSNRDIENRARR